MTKGYNRGVGWGLAPTGNKTGQKRLIHAPGPKSGWIGARQMTTLFDSVAVVKPNTFARGILPFVGQNDGRKPYTQADLDWAAANLNADTTSFDVEPDYDAMAAESAALDRHEMGLCL